MRLTDDFDLMRSLYKCSEAYQREDLDSADSFALARLVQKLLANNFLDLKCCYFTFLYL